MTASIDYLPIWKKDSTPEEFIMEIAAIARKYPERFKRIAILYEETLENGNTKFRYHTKGANNSECLALGVFFQHYILEDSQK